VARRPTSPTTKIVAGCLLLLIQAISGSPLVPCADQMPCDALRPCNMAQCIGYNGMTIALWALGFWFVYAGFRDRRRRARSQRDQQATVA